MISDDLFQKLKELTKENELDVCIQNLALKYIETKLAYWKLVDKGFQEKKGMSFVEYEDTKRDEWDGKDWLKIEEFHDWEGAISGIEYYEDLKDKWTSNNFNKNLQVC